MLAVEDPRTDRLRITTGDIDAVSEVFHALLGFLPDTLPQVLFHLWRAPQRALTPLPGSGRTWREGMGCWVSLAVQDPRAGRLRWTACFTGSRAHVDLSPEGIWEAR